MGEKRTGAGTRSPARGERHRAQSTIVDVAREANVSVATVSRALNSPDRVRPETLARIKTAVSTLGFRPTSVARTLVSGRSRTVGAITPTMENPSFALLVDAVQTTLDEAGYTLLLASSQYDAERELREVQTLVGHGVDGLVLVGSTHHPQLVDFISGYDIPWVTTFTSTPLGDGAFVGFDNHKAAYELTEYLLDLGHTRFGVITGRTAGNDRAAARVAGIRDAMAKRGLALPHEGLMERPYRISDGQMAFRSIIAGATPPTAVMCGNDVLAFGALSEAHRMGLDVPGQVSITGFDDHDFAAYLSPPLTTVRVPVAEIGKRSAEILLARLNNQVTPHHQEVEVNIIVRKSTGAVASV